MGSPGGDDVVRRGAGAVAGNITIEVKGRRPDLPADRPETLPGLDPFGFDAAFRDRVRPAFQFLHDRYWRVDVRGAENVPQNGPVLLVANHSGAVPFDGAMIVTAGELHGRRFVRFLYDRFVDNLSPVATFYRRVGGVTATRENAVEVLRAGEPLLIFPEGVSGVAKPFGDRYRLRTFTHGFARLALALDVPIVPVAVVGAEEIYPLVGRAEGVGKMFGMPYLPITPFFPVLGMLGALPLPTKWYIRFGKPIRLAPAEGEECRPRARLEAVRFRRTIQGMVTRMRRRRRSVFFG
jgi:1-acyl-sn-glycerol-3-phosphate acyltransferase